MISRYEIKLKELLELKKFSKKYKINLLMSVFDEKSLKLLNKINYNQPIKIPSGEITNYFLLNAINLKKNKIIVSTGMSNNKEIIDAINLLAKTNVYSLTKKNSVQIINKEKLSFLRKKIILLHCISDYPADLKYSNLKVIQKFKKNYSLTVGFSDHSTGSEAAIASVYSGSEYLEKHFTLDKKMKGPDHKASLNFKELKLLVKKIRNAEKIFGNGNKIIQKCEIKNVNLVRKYMVAKKNIKKNEKFTLKNLTAKRSSKGISPMKLNRFLGVKAKKNYLKDELI